MRRITLLLITACATPALASAQPLKVDRTIGKEPVYRTKTPKYGLLVFGPEAKERVWMVLDGEVLYVDHNGNGDLTEPDEKITAKKDADRDPEKYGYSFEISDIKVGGRIHKGLHLYVTPLKLYETGWRA